MHNFPLKGSQVTIYNTQSNEWLGQSNGIQYLTRLGNRRMAFIKKPSSISTAPEPKAIKSLLPSFTITNDMSDPLVAKLTKLATNEAMAAAMGDTKLAFYNKLPVGAPFIGVRLCMDSGVFLSELFTKSDYDCKEKYGFVHKTDRNTNSWYTSHNGNMVFMTPESWDELNKAFAESAAKIDVPVCSYHEGYGFVNVALLRIAQIMGPHAKIIPCDPFSKTGWVHSEPLSFSLTESNYMDLSLFANGSAVATRADICSIPEEFPKNETAAIPQIAQICMLSCAAFEMIFEYKTTRKQRRKAG